MARLLNLLSTTLAIGVGLIMLFGLLAGDGVLNTVSDALLQIAVITVALSILFGIANLLLIHAVRLRRRERGWPYSIVLLAGLLLTLGLWVAGADAANRILLEDVQMAAESALAALLVFTLIFGAYRLMRQRVTWSSVLFTFTLLLVLAGALTFNAAGGGIAQLIADVRAWVLAVPVSAGARGLLLGIALATVIAAIRILIGQERSFRD